MRKINLIGRRFGKLVVTQEAPPGKRGIRWLCKCDCGGEVIAYRADLQSGRRTSCNCLRWKGTLKHGLSNSKIRQSYYNMRKRCDDPNSKSYKDYGGRGIKYSSDWKTFEGFLKDMSEGYREGLTLDRIDVNGDYNKENCRWVDKKTQANNTRTNRYIEFNGERLTAAELAEKYNIDYELFRHRLMKGWSVERAMQPVEREVITYNGETKTVTEFAKERGMTYHQLKKRLMRGWTLEKALNQPLRKRS